MKIPKIITFIFILAIAGVGISQIIVFLSIPSDEEKLNQEFHVCGIEDLRKQLDSIDTNKFILVVVGDGVYDETPSKMRPYSSNYAQGWDLYEGVKFASNNKLFQAIKDYIEIRYVDDGGEDRCAELISLEIIKSPKVIGVIGHATSATTQIALENYRKGNIPVIIPTATTPPLLKNCKSCFRLPSNDSIQAKAIADFAVRDLKGENIYLVWDDSEAAKDYSNYLQKEVINLIGGKIKFRQPISFRPMNYEYLLKSIAYSEPDVLIFCGYGSMAREFFNGLRFEYKDKTELRKPRVILSDGNKISDIKDISINFNFEAYLSFPSEKPEGKSQFAKFQPETPPKEKEKMMHEKSYEIFGYDALILFSLAFEKSKSEGNISRNSLTKQLAKENISDELCYKYKFEKGENIESRYFIYTIDNDSVLKSYDNRHLSDVFKLGVSPKPISEFITRCKEISSEQEAEQFKKFVERLQEGNKKAQALILVSFGEKKEPAQTKVYWNKIYNDLVNSYGIEESRILLFESQAGQAETQLWLIPEGAEHPNLGNVKSIKAEASSQNTSSLKPK